MMANRRTGVGFSALAALIGVVACNAVTGADGIVIDNDEDDDGNGGMMAGVGAGMTTAGPGAGGNTTASGTGGATTSSGTMGAGAGPTECIYPSGPYGVAQGNIVPPNLSWQGYAPGSSTPSTFTMESLFDCDGTKDINAIIFDCSQFG